MPGTFDTLFDNDAPRGFFGGYRPQYQSVLAKMGGAPNAGQVMQVTENDAKPDANSAGAAPSVLTYPGGAPVLDPLGHPYLRPPGLDMQKNLAIGQDIADKAGQFLPTGEPPLDRDAMFAPHFIAGADMDYKRPEGMFGPYEAQYRSISYYNYGVMAAKAGFGEGEALRNAGLYNRIANTTVRNRYGLDGDDAEKWIKQGYEDYTNGRWTPGPSK